MRSKRVGIVYLVLCGIFLSEIAGLFYNSGIVKGVNERADRLKIYATASREDATVLPGDICDRNGKELAKTEYKGIRKTREDGNTDYETVRQTSYQNAQAYSQLLGYTGCDRKLDLFAEEESNIVGERNGYRLMKFLGDESYWGEDKGIFSTTGADGTRGQTAVLTIDDDLQTAVYNALQNEMSTSDMGSAVVMDAKTGEILSMVSFPCEYDFSDLDAAMQKMKEDEENTNTEPGYPVSYKNAKTPGSIWKVVMACALLDHDMGDFTVSNTSFTDDSGWECNGSLYDSGTIQLGEGDEIGLECALNISSNVYFAKAALALGKEKLEETASGFMLEQESDHISTDFGYVMCNWDLEDSSLLAQTGIGQGHIGLSTVYAGMIAQAIANGGKMMQPYMVKSFINEDQKVVYEGKPEVLSNATSKSTAKKVTSYLVSTAKEICQVHGLTEAGKTMEKYAVAGKTGTAEVGENAELNNAWYLSFAPADDPQYVVVVNQCKTSKQGYEMVPVAAEIYEYLFE